MERYLTPDEQRLERAKKRVNKIKGFYKHLMAYIVVNVILIIMQYISLDEGEVFFQYSTFSTAFFWGIGLFFHSINVFGKNFFLGENWEEKKIKEYMDKNQNNKWE
ncbi:2TM domain-containing protein [Flavobacterium sp. SM2513]|uniref:2TM domain-containing protein n=1 Tax=Flavobacterium sp. SM2513 TaxID=3424766 RepID=UPI003D7FE71B